MDGGGHIQTGLRQLVAGMSNADAIAFAVVGAARAYGDDPVASLTTTLRTKLSPARAVAPAINALARDKADIRALSRILGRNPEAVETARGKTTPGYLKALDGARALIDFAAEAVADDDAAPPDQDLAPAPTALPAEAPEDRARTVRAFAASAAQKLAEVKPFEPPKGASTVTAQTSPFGLSAAAAPAHGASVRARVLEALDGRSLNAQSLATLADAKEMVIGQTLSQLLKEGLVQRDGEGCATSRGVRWSLAAAWEGA